MEETNQLTISLQTSTDHTTCPKNKTRNKIRIIAFFQRRPNKALLAEQASHLPIKCFQKSTTEKKFQNGHNGSVRCNVSMISPPLFLLLLSVAMSRFIGKKRTSIFTTYLIKKSCYQKYRGLVIKGTWVLIKGTGVLFSKVPGSC